MLFIATYHSEPVPEYLRGSALHKVRTPSPKHATLQCFRGIIVRCSIAEATASVTFLCHYWTCALPTVETAAFRRTISVRRAGAGDELSSSCDRCGTASCGCCLSRSCSNGLGGVGLSLALRTGAVYTIESIVVWLSVSESASLASLIGNEGSCTFSRCEPTAF